MSPIRATYISWYVKSPFLLWAHLFADSNDADEENAFDNLLIRRGVDHEQEVISSLYPQATILDESTSFSQLKQVFLSGEQLISQAPLLCDDHQLSGTPDILEKQPGKSCFGNYHYVVKEIKYAKKIKLHHILQAALYNKILGCIQEYTPKEFFLINHDMKVFSYAYKDYVSLLDETILEVERIVNQEIIPLPVYSESYPWKSLSKRIAQENNDLSLLSGVGRSIRDPLYQAGITNLRDFISAKKDDVLSSTTFSSSSYNSLLRQAKSLVDDKQVVLSTPDISEKRALFLDVEADTHLDKEYLFGVLDGDSYKAFFADTPDDEQEVWTAFCSYIRELDDVIIYHYSSYEKTSIKKLYRKYGCDPQTYKKMHSLLCDLQKILRRSVVLPVPSYSIKSIAKYLGFSWHASDANGANSMQWYQQYLQGRVDRKEKLLLYNHDDVLATKVVYGFLQSIKKT